MYTVIGTVKSRALRVIWMLEELDVQFDHIAAPPQSEGVIQVSPSGKVPVLVEDGVPITDSTAILQYLADKHGQFTHPAGTLDRASAQFPMTEDRRARYASAMSTRPALLRARAR